MAQTMDRGERGVNPVSMTYHQSLERIWPSLATSSSQVVTVTEQAMEMGSRSLLKTWWEKEKMLVTITIIFSFSCHGFLPIRKEFPFPSYNYFVVSKCFQFGLKICYLVKG